MILRLLLVLAFALVVSSAGTSVSPDAVVAVEHEGETAADAEDAHLVLGGLVLATTEHPIPRADPDSIAPVPPFRHGVFRPPRAAFD